jgi:hypothetical protein
MKRSETYKSRLDLEVGAADDRAEGFVWVREGSRGVRRHRL